MIVKEWSEHQLGTQFPSLHALACYLVLNLSVSSGSAAATLVTAVAESHLKGSGVSSAADGLGVNLSVGADDQAASNAYGSSKHREMQLQLQRKLQQKSEVSRDHKRKIQVYRGDKFRICGMHLKINDKVMLIVSFGVLPRGRRQSWIYSTTSLIRTLL